jgi:hypothetical protein
MASQQRNQPAVGAGQAAIAGSRGWPQGCTRVSRHMADATVRI